MKKIFITLAAVCASVGAMFAQTPESEPNRLLLTNALGEVTGQIIDRIDNISFARVEGEVKADVEILSVGLDTLHVAVTRTEECQYYKLDVVTKIVADQLSDPLNAIRYLGENASTFYEDYTNAELTGISLTPSADYAIMTIGYDRYGIACDVVTAPFTTPGVQIVGDPKVEAETMDVSQYSFSIKFTPNDDVEQYWCVAEVAGNLQQQYEMFGPMFGFANFGEMIQMWGYTCDGEQTKSWTDMNPNTDYEVFVVCSDVNGNLSTDYQVFNVSTLGLGGEGEALVEIVVGDYKVTNTGTPDEPALTYSQYVEYNPNDQASCYRFGLYLASEYDANTQEIRDYLCSEPPMPNMAYWYYYEPYFASYGVEPETEVVAIAAGKNINGEWGEITEVRFTTPSIEDAANNGENAPARTAAKGVIGRIASPKAAVTVPGQGRVPSFATPAAGKIRLN